MAEHGEDDTGTPGTHEGPREGTEAPPTRCGFIAIIGAPNAGKSTLVNTLVGSKVTIVSHKVQTTRVPIRGIAIEGASQLVFIDTPGIFRPKRRLDRAMVEAAWSGAHDADAIVLLVDAVKGFDEDVAAIIKKLEATQAPCLLVVNKIDKLEDKGALLPLVKRFTDARTFARVFMISALDGKGVGDLKRHLAEIVPQGPWHYPEDEISDAPLRVLASELTREKIYHWLHDELPYATTVETTSWKNLKDGSVRIEQTIFVARESQRKIVLGKDGQSIKRISQATRKELSEILEKEVHLFLFVKVREDWEADPERYREMGLDFPKE